RDRRPLQRHAPQGCQRLNEGRSRWRPRLVAHPGVDPIAMRASMKGGLVGDRDSGASTADTASTLRLNEGRSRWRPRLTEHIADVKRRYASMKGGLVGDRDRRRP